MQVNKINSNNFSGRMILKSKDARFINLLNDIDFNILKKGSNTQARFNAIATSNTTNGYWQGKLLTKQDIQTPYTINDNDLPAKTISSLNDILEIPAFKNVKKEIKTLYDNIFKS